MHRAEVIQTSKCVSSDNISDSVFTLLQGRITIVYITDIQIFSRLSCSCSFVLREYCCLSALNNEISVDSVILSRTVHICTCYLSVNKLRPLVSVCLSWSFFGANKWGISVWRNDINCKCMRTFPKQFNQTCSTHAVKLSVPQIINQLWRPWDEAFVRL